MKEITLKIPDDKFDFFIKLAKELGIKISEEVEIPEEHKTIVRERMVKSDQNPERLLDWEQMQDRFELD